MLSEVPKTTVLTVKLFVCRTRVGFGFTLTMSVKNSKPRHEHEPFHFICLIGMSGPVVPCAAPALLSETLSWILMAWPEMHAIKLAWPFLSVLSLVQKLMNRRHSSKHKRGAVKEIWEGLVGGYFSESRRWYKQICMCGKRKVRITVRQQTSPNRFPQLL